MHKADSQSCSRPGCCKLYWDHAATLCLPIHDLPLLPLYWHFQSHPEVTILESCTIAGADVKAASQGVGKVGMSAKHDSI